MNPKRLTMARFAPAAPNGRDAVTVYLLIASIALALALLWLAFSAVRPLASVEAEPVPPVPDVPRVEFESMDFAGRAGVVAELTGQNYFADGRAGWADRPSLAQSETADGTPPPRPVAPTNDTGSRVVNERGEVISVAEKDDASDAMKLALENLGLKGLFVSGDGVPHAMIVRKHEDKPGYSTTFTVGEEFIETKTAASPWRVEHIDLDLDRVALSRKSETVWLNLRARTIALAPAAVISNRVFDPETSIPVVQQITMAELRAALIEEGLEPAEVDALIAAAEAMDPERDARTAALVDAVKQVTTPATSGGAADPSPSDPASPDDIQTLLEMMANNIPPTPEMMEKFNNPSPEPEKKKDEDPE
ncbi:MAG: hypothetical protein RLN60_00980 [Phycisphaerales bacterium]